MHSPPIVLEELELVGDSQVTARLCLPLYVCVIILGECSALLVWASVSKLHGALVFHSTTLWQHRILRTLVGFPMGAKLPLPTVHGLHPDQSRNVQPSLSPSASLMFPAFDRLSLLHVEPSLVLSWSSFSSYGFMALLEVFGESEFTTSIASSKGL